jgi:hypothetical protein
MKGGKEAHESPNKALEERASQASIGPFGVLDFKM